MTMPPREAGVVPEPRPQLDLRSRVLAQLIFLEGEKGPRRNLIRPRLSHEDRETIVDDFTLVATSKNRGDFLQMATEIDEIREANGLSNDPAYSTTFIADYDARFSALSARTPEAIARIHTQLQPGMIRQLALANFPDRPELLEAYYNPLINTFILEDVQTDLV